MELTSCAPLSKGLVSYGKVQIVNFGENIDTRLLSPRYFGKYYIPFYKKRAGQLKKAGGLQRNRKKQSFKTVSIGPIRRRNGKNVDLRGDDIYG